MALSLNQRDVPLLALKSYNPIEAQMPYSMGQTLSRVSFAF